MEISGQGWHAREATAQENHRTALTALQEVPARPKAPAGLSGAAARPDLILLFSAEVQGWVQPCG